MCSGASLTVLWLCTFVSSSLINGVLSKSFKSVSYCERHLNKVLLQPKFKNVVVQAFDDHINETGFVYSDLTLYHQLIGMYALGSGYVREDIRDHLGLDPTCDNVLLCAGMDNVIQGLIHRQSPKMFSYVSILYHQNNTAVMGLDACATPIEHDFNKDLDTVFLEINRGYKENFPYSDLTVNPNNVFYLFITSRVSADVFGNVTQTKGVQHTFSDLRGEKYSPNWLEIPGPWWRGYRSPHQEPGNKSDCPSYVDLYRAQINNGSLYSLFFKPEFTANVTYNEKKKCFREIFGGIRGYINLAIDGNSSFPISPNTYDRIAVPMMDLSTIIDLKTTIQEEIEPLFESNEIEGIGRRRHSLHELSTWENMSNKPDNITEKKATSPPVKIYLRKPFVYAIVDNSTKIVLKAGAFLRPEKASL